MATNDRFYESNLRYGRERSFKKHLEEGLITPGDEQLLQTYVNEKLAGNEIGELRANKIVTTLVLWRRFIKNEYKDITIEDVYEGNNKLKSGLNNNNSQFKKNTLYDYIRILKAFLYWCNDNNKVNHPLNERKLRMIRAKKDQNVTRPEDLPTEEDVLEIIRWQGDPLKRALFATTYEAAARIGEPCRTTWNDLLQDEYGYKIYIHDQKTGVERFGRLTMSCEYLNTYKNTRVAGKNDFVFTMENGRPLTYTSAKRYIREAIEITIDNTKQDNVRDSLLSKDITPHDLRRARITHMLIQGYSEYEIKMLAWGNPNSQQLKVYAKAREKDLDQIYLAKAGVVKRRDDSNIPTAPRPCSNCHTINGPTSDFCSKCGYPLTEEKINAQLDYEARVAEMRQDQDVIKAQIKILSEKLAKVESG